MSAENHVLLRGYACHVRLLAFNGLRHNDVHIAAHDADRSAAEPHECDTPGSSGLSAVSHFDGIEQAARQLEQSPTIPSRIILMDAREAARRSRMAVIYAEAATGI